MKKFSILSILVLMTVFPVLSCKKEAGTKGEWLGIVTASKLAVREKPEISSKVIKYLTYGLPVHLTSKSDKTVKVDKTEDYWYYSPDSKGWIYGGFLITQQYNPEGFGKYSSEMIRCNVICGGASCAYSFKAVILGAYYVAPVFLIDYPQKNDPFYGVIIGKYSVSGETRTFSNAEKIGAYSEDLKWIDNIKKYETHTSFYAEKFKVELVQKKDSEGDFFVDLVNKNNIGERKGLREKCKSPDAGEIWVNAYKFRKLNLEESRKEIASLLKDKN